MTTIRTDVHCPSKIAPSDYEYVGQECEKDTCPELVLEMRRRIQEHMARTGGTYSHHEHGGNCAVCGSVNAIYTVLFWHKPSNTYIRTGQDCAAKIDASLDGEMSLFRKHVGEGIDALAGKRKAQAVLAEAGLSQCWTIFTSPFPAQAPNPEDYGYNAANGAMMSPEQDRAYRAAYKAYDREMRKYEPESIIQEMIGKLVKYGSISEKQVNFLRSLLDRINNRAAREAQRAAESVQAADCPSGRIEIVGEVLSFKVTDTDFGQVTKMLVRHESGWKVWGTCPSSLACDQGDVISFVATITVSREDKKFGFFSRPSKSRMVKAAEHVPPSGIQ
jgi:hypothetical protein